MGTSHQTNALQRLFSLKTLANKPKNGHFTIGPLYALFALRGKADVFDVVFY
jgi:hypothetical protein